MPATSTQRRCSRVQARVVFSDGLGPHNVDPALRPSEVVNQALSSRPSLALQIQGLVQVRVSAPRATLDLSCRALCPAVISGGEGNDEPARGSRTPQE